MQNIERANRKAEKALAEASLFRALGRGLEGVPEPDLMVSVALWGSEASLKWKVDSISQLTEILAAVPPMIPRSRVSNTCVVSLKPTVLAKEGESQSPIEPVTMDVNPGDRGYPLNMSGLEFNWFSTVSGRQVCVSVAIREQALNDAWPYAYQTLDRFGRKTRYKTVLKTGGFNGQTIRWASGSEDSPNTFSLYFERSQDEDPLAFPRVLEFLAALSS